MDRRTWIIVGVIALVAVVSGYLLKDKSADTDTSQLPSDAAAANYSVPPNIGAQVDNTGGANFPQGEYGYTYTVSNANSLPSSGDGS